MGLSPKRSQISLRPLKAYLWPKTRVSACRSSRGKEMARGEESKKGKLSYEASHVFAHTTHVARLPAKLSYGVGPPDLINHVKFRLKLLK